MSSPSTDSLLTFGEHLEVLRKMLFRIVALSFVVAFAVFFFKEAIFRWLLAPCTSGFVTFGIVNKVLSVIGAGEDVYTSDIELIATDLPSQFMAHLSMSLYIGILVASPLIIYELFRFVAPALYDKERKYASRIIISAYLLFVLGLAASYFLLFPVSCRFLATYSVSEHVKTMVTLDSYLSTFVSLTLLMGLVFQLPILSFFLARMGVISPRLLTEYRKHAFVLILIVAAVITPPDVMTLTLVAFPLYLLYEVSIVVVKISLPKQIK